MLCRERGVELHRNDPVVNLEYGSTGEITAVQTVQRRIRPRHLVIAAGAWSGLISGQDDSGGDYGGEGVRTAGQVWWCL